MPPNPFPTRPLFFGLLGFLGLAVLLDLSVRYEWVDATPTPWPASFIRSTQVVATPTTQVAPATQATPASRPNPKKPRLSHKQVKHILQRVSTIHGAPGPFAVAGYRMAQYARKQLQISQKFWRLHVTHFTPQKVQWSCIADGLQAATGASPGKLNLHIRAATSKEVRSRIIDRKTQRGFVFRLRPSFIQRFFNTPRQQLRRASQLVAQLPDAHIFSVQPTQPTTQPSR